MPMLLRVAHESELPEGVSVSVKVRGVALVISNEGGVLRARGKASSRGEGPSYRTQVRGDIVYVAMDADRQEAPAVIQRSMGVPETIAS